jgi:hypothetical protein
MLQKELARLPEGFPVDSPLQKVVLKGVHKEVFLKREDLLYPAGGNKVRRFRAWLDIHRKAHTVVAMSDPGAHTFQVLQSFLDQPRYNNRIKRLLFLETLRPTNPYSESIRTGYLGDKRIKVLAHPAWMQTILLQLSGTVPGVASLGIGGSVRLSPNPFSAALEEAQGQVAQEGFDGRLLHIFPIASGTMLDGFLASPRQKSSDSFIGVMTGHPITRRLLSRKYSSEKSVSLVAPEPIIWNNYIEKARAFHAQTGVWLDPVHTIHLLNAIERFSNQSADGIVLWITCPRIADDPALLLGGSTWQ